MQSNERNRAGRSQLGLDREASERGHVCRGAPWARQTSGCTGPRPPCHPELNIVQPGLHELLRTSHLWNMCKFFSVPRQSHSGEREWETELSYLYFELTLVGKTLRLKETEYNFDGKFKHFQVTSNEVSKVDETG